MLRTGTEKPSAGKTPQSYNLPLAVITARYSTSAGASSVRAARADRPRPVHTASSILRLSATGNLGSFVQQPLEAGTFLGSGA